jgi:photosystem II stability/assembly factor-like uncharacterized protein
MRLVKIFFLSTFISLFCFSQDIQWKELSGLPGCFLLREGANRKLYAVSDFSIYSSTNNGLSWYQAPSPTSQILELATHNEIGILRVSANANFYNQAYLTTDNGVTWNRIYAARGGYGNYTISDEGIIYGLAEITDQGYKLVRYGITRWDTLGVLIPRIATSFNWALIDHSNTFVVDGGLGYGGILISKDFGATWLSMFEGQTVNAACATPRNAVIIGISQSSKENLDGGVYTSTDHGSSWVDVGLKDKKINSVSADSAGDIYVATSVGIYCYRSVSQVWEFLGPSETELVDILATSSGPILTMSYHYSYPIAQGVMYRSIDKGGFWSPSSARGFGIFSLSVSHSGNILAGTLGDRIVKAENNGTSWQQLPPGSIADNVYSFFQYGPTIYAGTDEGLYSSTDEGETWKIRTEHAFNGSAYSVVVQGNGKILIATNFGLYASTDGGDNWTPSGLDNAKVLFLANSKTDIIYAATDNDGIFSSTDNGNTWQSRGLVRNDMQTIVVNDVGDVYVGVYGGVFRSANNGASWTQSIFTNTYVYSIAFNGLQDVFAGTYNGLFRTSSGQNWARVGFTGQTVLTLAFDNSHNLLAGLYQGGVYISTQPLTEVELISDELPMVTHLEQNYPNPFNPTTNFRFQISQKSGGLVTLKVYDLIGREVITLLDEVKQPGTYQVTWDANGFASGVYYYQLHTKNFFDIKKMILIK